jgi:hypothetical protein
MNRRAGPVQATADAGVIPRTPRVLPRRAWMYVRASADDGYLYGGEPGATRAHRGTTSVTEEAR